MIRTGLTGFAIGSALMLLAAAPASAQTAHRAWVSGHGVDQAGCGAPTAPCRSLQYAHDHIVTTGGEIDILDPAGYGAITITKAISIVNDGVGTAGVQQATFGQNAITVAAGAGDNVTLRGLNIDGLGAGNYGIKFTSGQRLTVSNCVIRHFTTDAIALIPTTSMSFSISNVVMDDNNNSGFHFFYTGSSGIVAVGTVDHVEIDNNGNGFIVFDSDVNSLLSLTLADSIVSNNANDGVYFGQIPQANTIINNTNASYNGTGGFHIDGGYARFSRSTAYGNDVGVNITNGGTAESYGDNEFVGNNTLNLAGTLSPPTGNR